MPVQWVLPYGWPCPIHLRHFFRFGASTSQLEDYLSSVETFFLYRIQGRREKTEDKWPEKGRTMKDAASNEAVIFLFDNGYIDVKM